MASGNRQIHGSKPVWLPCIGLTFPTALTRSDGTTGVMNDALTHVTADVTSGVIYGLKAECLDCIDCID